MKAAIALYYIVCYSVNLLNLCLLAFLWLRGRRESQRQELLFMSGLMLISLSLTLPGLLVTDPADWSEALKYAFLAAVSAGICLVAGASPGYLHSFRPDRLGRRVTRVAWLAAGGLFCAVLTELCLTGTNNLILLCFVAMLAAIAWSTGWFFWQVFRHRSSFLANPAARVTLIMCIVTLAAMPLMALNDFFNALPFLRSADGKQRIVLVPLFLAVWSVALIRKNLREFTQPAPAPDMAASTDLGDVCPEPANLAACFGLSERELEVLPWLAAGLSYEEIGDKLCISHSTVKTHVRSIYKKMAVSGKIALISRLRELNHPIG